MTLQPRQNRRLAAHNEECGHWIWDSETTPIGGTRDGANQSPPRPNSPEKQSMRVALRERGVRAYRAWCQRGPLRWIMGTHVFKFRVAVVEWLARSTTNRKITGSIPGSGRSSVSPSTRCKWVLGFPGRSILSSVRTNSELKKLQRRLQ
jgi:hypothetical protein